MMKEAFFSTIFILLLCTLHYSFAETLYAVRLSKKDLDILQAIDTEVDRLEAECKMLEERFDKPSPTTTVIGNSLQTGGLNPFYQYERHSGIPQPRKKESEAGVLCNPKNQTAGDRDEEELPPPPPRRKQQRTSTFFVGNEKFVLATPSQAVLKNIRQISLEEQAAAIQHQEQEDGSKKQKRSTPRSQRKKEWKLRQLQHNASREEVLELPSPYRVVESGSKQARKRAKRLDKKQQRDEASSREGRQQNDEPASRELRVSRTGRVLKKQKKRRNRLPQPNYKLLGFPQIEQDERKPLATGPMGNPEGSIWRERDIGIEAEEENLVHKKARPSHRRQNHTRASMIDLCSDSDADPGDLPLLQTHQRVWGTKSKQRAAIYTYIAEYRAYQKTYFQAVKVTRVL